MWECIFLDLCKKVRGWILIGESAPTKTFKKTSANVKNKKLAKKVGVELDKK